MKDKLNRSHVYFIVILLLIAINIYPQNYPKYGSDEWKKLTLDEKQKSIQIPEEKLSLMSTTELIQAYLDFPLTCLIDAYDNKLKGYDRIYKEFNGLRELMKRNDSGTDLINFYKKMSPGKFDNNWTSVQKGQFAAQINYIELLLAQENIISGLNKVETKELLNALILNFESKIKNIDLHAGYGLERTAFPIAKTIFLKGDVNGFKTKIKDAIGNSGFLNGASISSDKINEIISIAKDFLQKY